MSTGVCVECGEETPDYTCRGMCRRCYNRCYYPRNREAILAQVKQHRLDNLEHFKEKDARYYRENREKRRQRDKAYYERNRERIRAYKKQYEETNKERLTAKYAQRYREKHEQILAQKREYQQRMTEEQRLKRNLWGKTEAGKMARRRIKAKRRGAEGDITAGEWAEILAAYDGRCAYCGSEERITMEHVIPLGRGGRNDPENVVPACANCNSSKNARPMLKWMLGTGRVEALRQIPMEVSA